MDAASLRERVSQAATACRRFKRLAISYAAPHVNSIRLHANVRKDKHLYLFRVPRAIKLPGVLPCVLPAAK